MRTRVLSVGLLACLIGAPSARAQSLTDVARAEEARRKTVKTPAKVYTNDDLARPDAVPAGPAAAPAAAPADSGAAADGKKADATKPAADDSKKDEKYWRDRMTAAKEAAAHDKVLIDALQSRINALTTDFVNTSDPAQRALVEQNRKTALGELDRLSQDLDKQSKAIADIQEEARKANVPPGWLR